jgi:hypothetical protein
MNIMIYVKILGSPGNVISESLVNFICMLVTEWVDGYGIVFAIIRASEK